MFSMAMSSSHCGLQLFWCFFTLFVISRVTSFPESSSPIMVIPPLDLPSDVNTCSWVLLRGSCASYCTEPIIIPDKCAANDAIWDRMVLDFAASEQGTQYDRVGTVWIGDIQVLRTTTAEPTSAGIIWSTKRDISNYRKYLQTYSNVLNATASIPNYNDATYNGVIQATVTLTIYLASDEASRTTTLPPDVIPLTAKPGQQIGLAGNQSFDYNIMIPNNPSEAYVEVYTSPHGCEEFYYSNADSDAGGLCGGGTYREVQVYIDGMLAGSTYHFPVVYTGGVCFYLWRPVSGIMSFNIPPKRFDITPFLHYFSDGQPHKISISVLKNDASGFWITDANLLTYDYITIPNTHLGFIDNSKIVRSEISFSDSTAQITETKTFGTGGNGFDAHTQGYHYYDIERTMTMNDGNIIKRSIRGYLGMFNDNSLKNSGSTGVTNERTLSLTVSTISTSLDQEETSYAIFDDFPAYVYSFYQPDGSTYDLNGTLDYTYDRLQIWTSNDGSNYGVNIRDHIYSNAAYSPIVRSDVSIQHFGISSGQIFVTEKGLTLNGDSCYSRLTSAKDGFIDHDYVNKASVCRDYLPDGLFVCEYDVCGSFSAIPTSSNVQSKDSNPNVMEYLINRFSRFEKVNLDYRDEFQGMIVDDSKDRLAVSMELSSLQESVSGESIEISTDDQFIQLSRSNLIRQFH